MIECPHCLKKFIPLKADPDHCPHCGELVIAAPTYTGPKSKKRPAWLWLGALVAIIGIVLVYNNVGFYTIPPIGALPEGITLLVWRAGDDPFFNSPDAECIRIQGGVSLLCRGIAITNAPADRIILRLSYSEMLYQRSVLDAEDR